MGDGVFSSHEGYSGCCWRLGACFPAGVDGAPWECGFPTALVGVRIQDPRPRNATDCPMATGAPATVQSRRLRLSREPCFGASCADTWLVLQASPWRRDV